MLEPPAALDESDRLLQFVFQSLNTGLVKHLA